MLLNFHNKIQSCLLSCDRSLYMRNIKKRVLSSRLNFRLLYTANIRKQVKINCFEKERKMLELCKNYPINCFKLKKNSLNQKTKIYNFNDLEKIYIKRNMIYSDLLFYLCSNSKFIMGNSYFINLISKKDSLELFLDKITNFQNTEVTCLLNYRDKKLIYSDNFLEVFKTTILYGNTLHFNISKLRDNLLFLQKLDIVKNKIRNYNSLSFLVNSKDYLKVKIFKSVLKIYVEIFKITSQLLFKKIYVKKVNKLILYNTYFNFVCNTSYLSLLFHHINLKEFIEIRLNMFNKHLDLDIFSKNKKIMNLLESKIFLLKKSLIKHGIFLRQISIKK